jgi:hypothetical protein
MSLQVDRRIRCSIFAALLCTGIALSRIYEGKLLIPSTSTIVALMIVDLTQF